jgi:hypothetical protein
MVSLLRNVKNRSAKAQDLAAKREDLLRRRNAQLPDSNLLEKSALRQ